VITRDEISKSKHARVFLVLALLTLVLLGAALMFTGKMTLIGMQVLGISNYTTHTQEINLAFTSTQEYAWELEEHPALFNLRSVMLNGETIGQGKVRATLITPDGQRYVIMQSRGLKRDDKITGMQVEGVTENATENTNETISSNETITNEGFANTPVENTSETGIITNEGFAQNDTSVVLAPEVVGDTNQTEGGEEQTGQEPAAPEKNIDISLRYQRGTRWDANDDGTASTEADAVDFTVAETRFSWDADESKICTRWTITSEETGSSTTLCNGNAECCGLVGVAPKDSSWDAPLHIYYEQYGTTASNTVSAQVIYLDQSLEVGDTRFESVQSDTETLAARFEAATRKEFSRECFESCMLPAGLNSTSYKILFEIENGTTLFLKSITYSIEDLSQGNMTVMLNPEITDSKGNVLPSTVEVMKKATLEKVAEKRIARREKKQGTRGMAESMANAMMLERGDYKINIDLTEAAIPVKKIELASAAIQRDTDRFLRVERVNITDSKSGFLQMYAIDPTPLNFTHAKVTATAKGSLLYKCKDWNFTAQQCRETCTLDEDNETSCSQNWTLIMRITPGQDYEINLTPEDPAFAETSEAVDVAISPIDNTTIVMAWVDAVETDISFKVFNTNGTNITDTIDADTTADLESRVAVAPINKTAFVLAWVDGPDDDVTFAVYDINGTNIVAATDTNTNVGTNTDVSLAQLGNRFALCYMDNVQNDASFRIITNAGTQAVAETDIDTRATPEATLQNLVSCAGISSTRWAYFYFDDPTNDATFAVRRETGASIVAPTDIDGNVGETGQVAVATLDADKFVMAFYDSTDDDITIAIRTSANGVVLARTDIDTNAGTESRVAVSAIRQNASSTTDSFVVAWWDQASTDIKAAAYDGTGSEITAPFTVETQQDTTYTLIDVMARDPLTGLGTCPGTFIVAYTNNSNVGVFKTYYINGTEWDGVCNPPTVNLVSPNNGNITPERTVNFTCNATDDGDLKNITFYWNYTGSWQANGTAQLSGKSNSTGFYRSGLNNTNITWNCRACDDAKNCKSAQANWSVSINYTDTPPVTTLNNPPDSNINTTNHNILFNCSATDDTQLVNISLYITNSTNQSFARNQTTPITGTSNSTSWTIYLADGNYTWNCLTYDSTNQNNWAANRTIQVKLTSETNPPNVTNLLTNNTIYSINDTVLITARVVDDTAVYNVTSNVTLPNNTIVVMQMTYDPPIARYTGEFNVTALLGTYTARVIAKDTNGNINDTQYTMFRVVRPYMNISKNDTPDPVQVGQYINYAINYTVNRTAGGIVLLDFQDFRFVTFNDFREDSPQLVESNAGTLVIVYHAMPGTNNDIYVIRSTDKGATWSSPIQVTDELPSDTYPNIFVDTDSTLLIVYSHETVAGYNDIWLVNSSSDGLTWSEPFAVTTTPTISEWEPAIEKDSTGMYYIAFEAYIAPDTDAEIYILNSSNLYGSWPNRTQATDNTYMDVDIEFSIVDDIFYFAWAPAYPDYQEIWFANITDPLTFASLDNHKVQITDNDIYDYETSVNRDIDGNIYIGWVGMVNVSEAPQPNWNRTSNEVFLASSYDDGQNWDIRRITDNNISDSYPGIVQTGSTGLYYISALRTNGTELDVTFAQRVFSPEDTISAIIDDKTPMNTSVTNIGQGGTLLGNMIRWTFPTIYAGENGQVTFTVRVNETVKNGTIINNTANATYYNTNNANMGLLNSTTNTTVIDTLRPNVTIITPAPASTYPQYSNVLIKVNVTDNGLVSNVTANISVPGGGWQLVTLIYNATSKLYERNFSNTATTGRYNITIIANDTTGNYNNTETSYFFITNGPPTTPTNLTCNGGSCTGSFSGNIRLNCSGSTDPDNDPLTYHVEAFYALARGNKTHLNATFEAGNDSFVYYDDLYNTSSPTQAVGQRVTSANCTSGSCLNVQLNINTPVTGANISGGWNRTVNITNAPTYLNITFSYKMRLSDSTEPTDNISIWYRDMSTGLAARGPQLIGITGTDFVDEYQTGTVTVRQYAVYNGSKTFNFGCRLYEVDAADENGECWLDNINITAVNTSDMPKGWNEIGTHTNTTTLLWSIYDEQPQTSVDFRCRARDTGSLTYSNYYTIGANATILVDTKPPWWYNNLTKPASPATYISGGSYQFNISWQDNGAINTSRIEHNFTGTPANYSFSAQNGYEYIYNYANLPVGTYYWKSYANDSAGNKNASDVFYFQVVRAPTNTTIYVNGTAADYTRNVSFTANITCVANVSGNVNITENGTQIAYGASPLQTTKTYTTLGHRAINCTYYTNQNYTGSNSTRNIYAIDAVPPAVTLNNPPVNYYNDTNNTVRFNCSATDNTALKNMTLHITNSQNNSFAPYQTNPLTGTSNSTSWILILAQGNYTWNCLGYDAEGNSAFATANRTIKINYTAFVPSIGFSLTLPGKAPVNASLGGNATATMMFNSTSNTYYNMEPCVQGTTDCQNATTPFFIYLNTGNVNLTINVSLDANLPAMFNMTVNTVRNNATATKMNTTPVNIVTNLLPGNTQNAYFFGSFINAFPADSTTRTLASKGNQTI